MKKTTSNEPNWSKKFFDQVVKVRKIQKAYFATKRRQYIAAAFREEPILDEMIANPPEDLTGRPKWLFDLVKEMRSLQNRWFRSKDTQAKARSKDQIEPEIDKEIDRVLAIMKAQEPKQPEQIEMQFED